MPRYAQINGSNICVSMTYSAEIIISSMMVAISEIDEVLGLQWADGVWVQPAPAAPRTLAEKRTVKLAALAQKRWEVETGGVTVDGSLIRTDATSQAKLTGAVTLAQSDQTLTSIDWEAQPGVWVTLDAPTIVALGVTVGRFVQACFSNARVLSEQITTASTHAALDAINLNTGWPS